MTIDGVKIKTYMILQTVFTLLCLLQNPDTEDCIIPDKLKYRKENSSSNVNGHQDNIRLLYSKLLLKRSQETSFCLYTSLFKITSQRSQETSFCSYNSLFKIAS